MPNPVAPANMSIQPEAIKPRPKIASPKPASQNASADATRPEGSFEDALARAKRNDDQPAAQAQGDQKTEEPKQTSRARGKKTENKKNAKGKSQQSEENPDACPTAEAEQKSDLPVDAEPAVSVAVQLNEPAAQAEQPPTQDPHADTDAQPPIVTNAIQHPDPAVAQEALAASNTQAAVSSPQQSEQPQTVAAPESSLPHEAKSLARPRVSELRPRPDSSPAPATGEQQPSDKPAAPAQPQVENSPSQRKTASPQPDPVASQSNAAATAQPQTQDDPAASQQPAASANQPATQIAAQTVQPPPQQTASQPAVSVPAVPPQPTLDQLASSHWSQPQIISTQQPQLADAPPSDTPALDATTAFQSMLEALTEPDPNAKSAPESDSLDSQSTLAPAPQPAHPQTESASAKPAQPQPAPRDPQFAEVNHPRIVTAIRSELMPHGGAMQLRLDPPELGALQVRIEMRDGVMTAAFQTSNDDAARLLSHSLGQLKHALESQGVSVEKLQVERTPREQSNNSTRDDSQQQQPGQQSQQEQQRRELLRRMWRRLSGGADPLDVTA